MSVRSGQSIIKTFTTRVFATGVATDADSLPTGTLYVNGTADAASVTVTNITTGFYKAAVTLPTLAVGDVVDLRINATVSSVTDNGIIWSDTKDLATDANGKSPATIADGDIAADAINAASLKADAVTKIQNGLSTLNEAQVNAQCDAAISDAQLATSSSISALDLKIDAIDNYLDTEVAAILAAVDTEIAAIKTITDQITFTVAGAVNVNVTSWLGFIVEVDAQNYPLIGTVNTKTGYALTSAYDPAKTAAQADTALSDLVWTDAKAAYLDAAISSASAPTVNQVRDGILNATAADFDTAGSIGEKINDGGAAGDPLSNAVPGSYPEGTAGFALGEVAAVRVLGPLNSVVPTVGGIRAGTTIVAYHFAPVEVGPISVFDDDGEPLNMSSYATDLAFIVFSWDGVTETLIHQLNYPNVTVGGDGNNQISLANTTPMTATAGRFFYGIRRRTSNVKVVRAEGEFIVKPMANVT